MQTAEQVAQNGAQALADVVRNKTDAVIGLATGRTPISLYKHLIRLHREEDLSFANVSSFNLDEYLGIEPENPQSYRQYMNDNLFAHVDIDLERTFFPECEMQQDPSRAAESYEEQIQSSGGIDIQLLGVGRNGHIGFNEPTSSLSSRTRVKTLTESTLHANADLFPNQKIQPDLALTMGIGTIMDAAEIVVLATGKDKAAAVAAMIEGPVTAMCPASTLQFHLRTMVLLDQAAASDLTNKSYFEWVSKQEKKLLLGCEQNDDHREQTNGNR